MANRPQTIGHGSHTRLGPVKQVDAGLLSVGYTEDGPADGRAVILLHGWPYDIHAYADVAPDSGSEGLPGDRPLSARLWSTRFLSADSVRNGQQSCRARHQA